MSENVLVNNSRATAPVVRREQADELTRFAASERVRYVEALTGARLPVSATVSDGCALLVGTRPNHPAVGECVTHDLPLDSDFLLRTVRWREGTALALTGRTSQAVLYAVYEFIERCGVTFLNTGGDLRLTPDPSLKLGGTIRAKDMETNEPLAVAANGKVQFALQKHDLKMILVQRVQ